MDVSFSFTDKSRLVELSPGPDGEMDVLSAVWSILARLAGGLSSGLRGPHGSFGHDDMRVKATTVPASRVA